MANPEDRVIAAIDELVDWELTLPQDDYERDFAPDCPVCGDEWHGLANGYCPGAYATAEQRTAYEENEYCLPEPEEKGWTGQTFHGIPIVIDQAAPQGGFLILGPGGGGGVSSSAHRVVTGDLVVYRVTGLGRSWLEDEVE